ncbi:MAG: hypothetical protein G5Z42_01915 [Caldisphaeraceae archaeon]|nr:hypothetical protein [Caldisphaeraceae archaeon]MEB3692412.1 hypothetical protein [Caldisphaeraceae archaeon]MEB3797563.1 hypothetical protein [Caldisphaeraceae archaeon]
MGDGSNAPSSSKNNGDAGHVPFAPKGGHDPHVVCSHGEAQGLDATHLSEIYTA